MGELGARFHSRARGGEEECRPHGLGLEGLEVRCPEGGRAGTH